MPDRSLTPSLPNKSDPDSAGDVLDDDTRAMSPQPPHTWSGPRSDTSFTATLEDGTWLLNIRIDSQSPVCLQSPHASHDLMSEHADVMDFCLAVARDAASHTDDEIRTNALSLIYGRDFYHHNSHLLRSHVAQARPGIEVTQANIQRLENVMRNADLMQRIGDRIHSALTRAVEPRLLSVMTHPASPTHH